jgi:hypothetical protein
VSEESGLQGWHRFIDRWETEGAQPGGGTGVTRPRRTSRSASPARSAMTATRSLAEVSYRRTGVPGRTILRSPIRGWRELDRACMAVTFARG